jgi:hypothetical protein
MGLGRPYFALSYDSRCTLAVGWSAPFCALDFVCSL